MTEHRVDGLAVAEPEGVRAVEAREIAGQRLKYYDYCMAAFAVILICSNLIGAGKVATLDLPLVGAVTFGAGIVPVTRMRAFWFTQCIGQCIGALGSAVDDDLFGYAGIQQGWRYAARRAARAQQKRPPPAQVQ